MADSGVEDRFGDKVRTWYARPPHIGPNPVDTPVAVHNIQDSMTVEFVLGLYRARVADAIVEKNPGIPRVIAESLVFARALGNNYARVTSFASRMRFHGYTSERKSHNMAALPAAAAAEIRAVPMEVNISQAARDEYDVTLWCKDMYTEEEYFGAANVDNLSFLFHHVMMGRSKPMFVSARLLYSARAASWPGSPLKKSLALGDFKLYRALAPDNTYECKFEQIVALD